MHPTTKVQKWGNSLAVRIPKGVIDAARIGLDDTVDFSAKKGIVMLRLKRNKEGSDKLHPYTLKALLRGVKPYTVRRVVDWGEDVGRETLEPWQEKQ